MEVSAFAGMLSPEAMAYTLNRSIDWLEGGEIPQEQCFSSLYADLIQSPVEAVRKVYDRAGMAFTEASGQRIRDYLAAKPQGRFGKHQYETADPAEHARLRQVFARYQSYFGVPNEI
jgi:hypothetical protein